jgi:hypothetical protein
MWGIKMTTIRDPQTDVSTADYIIDGNWGFDKKLTYTSSLGFTANTDIVDKQYVDSKVFSGPPDENNIYYIGKHGNDTSNDGRNMGNAFLTIQKGIDEAKLQSPTSSSEYVIKISDSGSYDSFNMLSSPYIKIEGNACQLQSTGDTFFIGDNNTLKFDKGSFISGGGTFIKKEGTAESYLKGNEIKGSNIENGIYIDGGSLKANVRNINVSTSNNGIYVEENASVNFTGQNITGKIKLATASSAYINIKNQTGDIEVGGSCNLTIIINGEFNGNLNVGEDSTVTLLIFYRTSSNDIIHNNSTVDIQYIGHKIFSHRNILVGGDYSINPRQETTDSILLGFTSGDYCADNTIIQASDQIDVEVGENNSLVIYPTSPDEYVQLGILIPIENKDLLDLLGNKASISFKSKWIQGATEPVSMALLFWTGEKDKIKRSVVHSWDRIPILSNNWIYGSEIKTVIFRELNLEETLKIENISIPEENVNNMGVFIWTQQPVSSISQLSISNVRCNKGQFAEVFALRHFTNELFLCRRFYSKSYDLTEQVGTSNAEKGKQIVLVDIRPAGRLSQFAGMNCIADISMLKNVTLTPYVPSDGRPNYIRSSSIIRPYVNAKGIFSGEERSQIHPLDGLHFFATYYYHWVLDARF